MKKKLSAYELNLLLTISIKADTIGFSQGSFNMLEERELIEMVGDDPKYSLTEKGKSFVKSLLKVKMPKQVWR